MATWLQEFERLSEIERKAIEEWKANRHAANLVYNAKEATNALLQRFMGANFPPHDASFPARQLQQLGQCERAVRVPA